MNQHDFYYIMSFPTTTDAMQAEKYAKDKIDAAIMPTPREISSGCGLSLRFMTDSYNEIMAFCQEAPVAGSLYKMELQKVNGQRPVEFIFEKTK